MSRIARFGDFRLNLETRELRRGHDLVALQAQAAQLLTLLVREAGGLVPHERIIAELWPDSTVDYEQGIHNVVRQVRRALGDDPRSPTFVETVPRQGYRFVAPVRLEAGTRILAAVRERPVPWIAATLVAAAIVVASVAIGARLGSSTEGAPLLAVLPLEANAAADTHPGAGTAWDLGAAIARTGSGIRVIGDRSVVALVEQGLAPLEIGRRLDATHAVVGDVSSWGDRTVVRVQLVATADGSVVWSGTFDRPAQAAAELRGEIASLIAMHLGTVLGGRKDAARTTLPPRVAGEFAKARYLLLRPTPEALAAAHERLLEVVRSAPDFADAHASLAEVALIRGLEHWGDARREAQGALARDPASSAALAVLGTVALYRDWDWAAAGESLRRASEVPGARAEAHVAYALYLATLGRHDRSAEQATRGLELDPLAALLKADVAYAYYLAGRYAEARAQAEEGVALGGAGTSPGLLIDVLLAAGDVDEAARQIARIPDLDVDVTRANDPQELERRYLLASRDRWARLPEERRPAAITLASVAARLGETEAALELLETAVRERSPHAPFLMVDPDFAPLRRHPRFRALLARVGHPFAQARTDTSGHAAARDAEGGAR